MDSNNVDVGNVVGDHNTLLNELLNAGKNFASLSSDENQRFEISSSSDYDLFLTKRGVGYYQPWDNQTTNHYYFDRVDLPSYLTSPEILTVIANKVFIRKSNELVLKDEYQQRRYLAPNDDPLMEDGMCIPLTDELLSICTKYIEFQKGIIGNKNRYGPNGVKERYYPLGNSPYETLEQRIENAIISGRSDRVLGQGATGPGVEHTVGIILKENNKSIKSCNVLIGSFSKLNSDKSNGDGSYRKISKYERWVRVVCD